MDFERARFNMIEQQIRPWGVLDPEILELLAVVRREDFVPPEYRSLAFTDMEVPLTVDGRPTGERMFPPRVEARLLQELAVRKHESALEIGTGSGYLTALLAHRARQVESFEIQPELAAQARARLAEAGLGAVVVHVADGSNPAAISAQFDVIVLAGGVYEVPSWLLERLNPGGRLAAIVGSEPVMRATLYTRDAAGGLAVRMLFETVTQPLRGFAARSAFQF